MPLSVERMPDAGAPQVGISIYLPGSHVVTVEVSSDAGRSWMPVQGGRDLRVEGSSFLRDHTVPLNVEAVYRLMVEGEALASTSITVPSETAWIQDPLNPRTAVEVACVRDDDHVRLLSPSLGTQTYSQAVDRVLPAGSGRPVAATGPRQWAASLPLHLRAVAASQGDLIYAIDDLIGGRPGSPGAGSFVLRGLPPALRLPAVVHCVAPEITTSPVVHGLLGQFHDWQMTIDTVAGPSARVSIPWWTYDQFAAMWNEIIAGVTYDDLVDASPEATYVDIQRDPTGGM